MLCLCVRKNFKNSCIVTLYDSIYDLNLQFTRFWVKTGRSFFINQFLPLKILKSSFIWYAFSTAVFEKKALSNINREIASQINNRILSSVLKNFAKFTGKNLCKIPFFNKDASLSPVTLLKNRLWHLCFSENFVEFLKTLYLKKHILKEKLFFSVFPNPNIIQTSHHMSFSFSINTWCINHKNSDLPWGKSWKSSFHCMCS